MRRIWTIYKNNIRDGQCNKLNEVFKRIEYSAGCKLTNWYKSKGHIKVYHNKDTYEAINESVA